MAKKSKAYFKFEGKEDLVSGCAGTDVVSLQHILVSLGYLRGTYEPGTVCSCTGKAVRRYQRGA